MRHLPVVVALSLGVVALVSTPALALPNTVTAHVPFAFHLGGRTLPAGDYRISPLSTLQQQVLFIRTTDGHHPAFVMTLPRSTQTATTAVRS